MMLLGRTFSQPELSVPSMFSSCSETSLQGCILRLAQDASLIAAVWVPATGPKTERVPSPAVETSRSLRLGRRHHPQVAKGDASVIALEQKRSVRTVR